MPSSSMGDGCQDLCDGARMCRASGVNDINIFCGGTSLRAKREGVGRGVEPI